MIRDVRDFIVWGGDTSILPGHSSSNALLCASTDVARHHSHGDCTPRIANLPKRFAGPLKQMTVR